MTFDHTYLLGRETHSYDGIKIKALVTRRQFFHKENLGLFNVDHFYSILINLSQ